MKLRTREISIALLTGLLASAGASADVTIHQKFKVDAVGTVAVLASEGTVTTSVADRKARTDNTPEKIVGLANKENSFFKNRRCDCTNLFAL